VAKVIVATKGSQETLDGADNYEIDGQYTLTVFKSGRPAASFAAGHWEHVQLCDGDESVSSSPPAG
jgi:hypothetical protein